MSYSYLMPTARKVISRAPVMSNARASLKQIISFQCFRRHRELSVTRQPTNEVKYSKYIEYIIYCGYVNLKQNK